MDFKSILRKFKEEIMGKPVGTLTSKEAWNLVRYDFRCEKIDKVVNKELSRIEELIIYKARNSSIEDSLIITVPSNKRDLYQLVRNHFVSKGFVCFFKEFEELEGELFLIISWKDGGREE